MSMQTQRPTKTGFGGKGDSTMKELSTVTKVVRIVISRIWNVLFMNWRSVELGVHTRDF